MLNLKVLRAASQSIRTTAVITGDDGVNYQVQMNGCPSGWEPEDFATHALAHGVRQVSARTDGRGTPRGVQAKGTSPWIIAEALCEQGGVEADAAERILGYEPDYALKARLELEGAAKARMELEAVEANGEVVG